MFPSNRIDVVQQLGQGRADLVVGSFTELPAGVRRSRLLREDEVIAVRTGHPLTRGKMTQERLLEFPHVVVEATGTMESETDGFTGKRGNGKRVLVESALQEFQFGKIGPTVRCWLKGFGIASRLPRERQCAEPPEFIAGTLAYMSPEQTGRMNRSIDSRSDLYSLGITLYQMLTGVLPLA